MNTQVSLSQAKRAVRLFSHEGVDKSIVKANCVKWLAAMSYLGDKHLLAIPVQRKGH